MTFEEYTQGVLRTAGNGDLYNVALGLAGEAGEFCDALKKQLFHGHDLDFRELMMELGDVLYYVAWGASKLGYSLEEVARENRVKLASRYPNGFGPEASINRKD